MPSISSGSPNPPEASSPESVVLTEYSGNPIFTATGADNYATYADVWFDDGTFYAAVHVDDGIELFTSSDGKTGWTSQGLILEPSASGWDSGTVGVPSLWKEGSTWHLLYRGTGDEEAIGYATASAAAGPYTRANSGEPVLQKTAAAWDAAGVEGAPGQPIKVGSTYYIYYESRDENRSIGVATSNDLITWTKHASNPIMVGGRFCPCVWKEGDWYYYAGAHYTGTVVGSEIELWRSRNPTFLPAEREYLGVVKRKGLSGTWDDYNLDTPTVLSDDVTRSTRDVTNGALWMYYAGTADGTEWGEGLLIGEAAPRLVEGRAEPFTVIGSWAVTDLAANRASSYMDVMGSASGVFRHIPVTRSGSITGVAIHSTGARNAGTCTATVVNSAGASLGLSVELNGTYTTKRTTIVEADTIPVEAGAPIGIALSSSSWGPTTADIIVTVEAVLR